MAPYENGNLPDAVTLVLLTSLVPTAAYGQSASDTDTEPKAAVIQPAMDGIFEAFETYPLVGISDMHGLAQATEFYEALVGDPRFAREIGNIVVEFGGAARQNVIDRYVDGEDVPYAELRQVWTDVVGWSPTITYTGYTFFFSQVRGINLGLPEDERIRVWLGEPPIVWEAIEERDEYLPYLRARESHPADLIVRNILEQDKKALVIYGDSHLRLVSEEEKALWENWEDIDPENAQRIPVLNFRSTLRTLVEDEYPGALLNIQVYIGFDDESCTTRFEQKLDDWPRPALATRIRGSALENEIRRCPPEDADYPPTMPGELQEFLAIQDIEFLFRDDAMLFLGPAASLTLSPLLPDILLDTEFRQEISRQMEIKTGQPLSPTWGRGMPVTPVPFELF